ncbi:NUDIX hydrolase [Alcanivorax sp. HI0083]|uniref:Nudix family hydrolase n=1 Tax=unclassified Alcanivorax TaxID=2638842 RepID=UPI0007B9AF70|nr:MULTISPECIES: Nudix family hydrolase [unclassified Alcanivorax]KZY37438.1 NUDIX hydrolase [Alcanivorax sp. HI0044]KZZ26339.1 NUDIX hydrolase [Alcanivorax sp. HI0083]
MTTEPTPAITVVAAIIRGEDGRICLSKRPDNKHQGGRWEFPGGKVEQGEALDEALARELEEELGMTGATSSPFMTIAHQYDDLHVTLHFRDVCAWRGEPQGREGQRVQWFLPDELSDLRFPAANQPVVNAMQLPEQLVVAPEDITLHELLAGIDQLNGEQQGLYLRQWSDHAEVAAIVAQCQQRGVKVWLRAVDAQSAATAKALGVFALHFPGRTLARLDERPAFDGIISAAVHDQVARDKASNLGLDMALVSPVLPTPTHPGKPALGWPQAALLMKGAPLACYALGGVTPGDLVSARDHGAVGVAGIRAFWP